MQYNVYKIHDLMVGGHAREAYALIERMLAEDSNPIGFLYSLPIISARCWLRGHAGMHVFQSKIVSHIMQATGRGNLPPAGAPPNATVYGTADQARLKARPNGF